MEITQREHICIAEFVQFLSNSLGIRLNGGLYSRGLLAYDLYIKCIRTNTHTYTNQALQARLNTRVPSKHSPHGPDGSLLQFPYFVSLQEPLEGRRLPMDAEAQQSVIGFSCREASLRRAAFPSA
jgi:hypothetical protein